MAKYKLRQFAELETFTNVVTQLQNGPIVHDHILKGNWNKEVFKNANPLVLELGCGKGEYTVGLARNTPLKNYIGVDLKGNRLWRGAKTALEENLENVRFLRCKIENIISVFSASEVDEIWITFPDPQPGLKREKRRLTSPGFIDKYRKILKPGGIIHLKTDSRELFEYTLEVIQLQKLNLMCSTFDLYTNRDSLSKVEYDEITGIKTYYEQKFYAKGFNINYLKFQIN